MRARSGARFELVGHQLTYERGRFCGPGLYELSCREGVKVYVRANDDRMVRILAEEGV